jgi:hypothetical protein
MQTSGTFSQDKAFPDAQIMFDALEFVGTGATPVSSVVTIAGINTPYISGTVAGTFTATANLSNLLLRTGVFAPSTAQTLSGQAFGTAAGLPGPQAAVAGTSSPSGFGINQVTPPVTKANLPTLVGSVAGAKPKGTQINWIDLLYVPGATTPVTSITTTVSQIQLPSGVGATPALISTIIPATTSPTTVAVAGKVTRTRLTPANPVMYTLDGTMIVMNTVVVYAAGSGLLFLGCILGCSFNFN